jgi:hypothetical protein
MITAVVATLITTAIVYCAIHVTICSMSMAMSSTNAYTDIYIYICAYFFVAVVMTFFVGGFVCTFGMTVAIAARCCTCSCLGGGASVIVIATLRFYY